MHMLHIERVQEQSVIHKQVKPDKCQLPLAQHRCQQRHGGILFIQHLAQQIIIGYKMEREDYTFHLNPSYTL